MSSPLGALPRPPMQDTPGHFTTEWAGWLTIVQMILQAASTAGTTAQRPTKNQFQGMPYFDTTLGKPVWLKTPGNAPVWVDATGAAA